MKNIAIFLAALMMCSLLVSGFAMAVEIEFWSTDNEEDRVAVYEAVAAKFTEQNPDITIKIVPVEEGAISQRIATAKGAGDLPDIIRMGVERAAAFTADGLLDEDAASEVIKNVAEDDFRAGPLFMVKNVDTGKYAAVPFDGWIQAIWYRADIFKALELAAPTSWETINAACDQLPGKEGLFYALTLGTDPGQNYGHQIFEQVAMSNNAWPFDPETGEVTFNTPEMIAALEFYTGLQRCAMPGPQYWRGARESYELAQSGMLFYSTYIMDDLVEGSGLEAGGNVEIAVEDLALKTGFAPDDGRSQRLGLLRPVSHIGPDGRRGAGSEKGGRILPDRRLPGCPGSGPVRQSAGAEKPGRRVEGFKSVL